MHQQRWNDRQTPPRQQALTSVFKLVRAELQKSAGSGLGGNLLLAKGAVGTLFGTIQAILLFEPIKSLCQPPLVDAVGRYPRMRT